MSGKAKGGLNEVQKKILEALASGEAPLANKDIAGLTGLEAKKISCNMSALKKKGLVESPARCKYVITPAGKAEL